MKTMEPRHPTPAAEDAAIRAADLAWDLVIKNGGRATVAVRIETKRGGNELWQQR